MSLFSWLRCSPTPKVTLAPMPRGAITPNGASVFQLRGWCRKGRHYIGPYATPFGTWHGRIEPAGDTFRCFIKNPPMDVVRQHPKWTCFSQADDAWWKINLAHSPIDRDANAVVVYIERLLVEAHRRAGRT